MPVIVTLDEILEHEDFVLVDLKKIKKVQDDHLKTKCRWSPYSGRTLQGWPVLTVIQGKVFQCMI